MNSSRTRALTLCTLAVLGAIAGEVAPNTPDSGIVVQSRDGMEAGIRRAEARKAAGDWPFEAYLHWFYGQMCFDPTAPDFIDRFIARVAAQGYDLP